MDMDAHQDAQELRKLLESTENYFVLSCLARSLFDLVDDPQTFRDRHAKMPQLVDGKIDERELEIHRLGIMNKLAWLVDQALNVDGSQLTFDTIEQRELYALLHRTFDGIDKRLGWVFRVVNPNYGCPVDTLVRTAGAPNNNGTEECVIPLNSPDVFNGFWIPQSALVLYDR